MRQLALLACIFGLIACSTTPTPIKEPDVAPKPLGSSNLQKAQRLNAARFDHAAVRLSDGRVLVMGGRKTLENPVPLFSTEWYDPASNQWTPGANLLLGRIKPGAALLPDGRVLIAGGGVPNLELYDPTLNTWHFADRADKRIDQATLEPNTNRVLLGCATCPTQAFDLTLERVIDTGGELPKPELRLPDGKRLQAGPQLKLLDSNGQSQNLTFEGRISHLLPHPDGATIIADGQVWRFDATDHSLSKLSVLEHGQDFNATAFKDGLVLVTGGRLSGPSFAVSIIK